MSEKKSFLEIVIMPITLALVSALVTCSINNVQMKNTQKISDAEIDAATIRNDRSRIIALEKNNFEILKYAIEILEDKSSCVNSLNELNVLVRTANEKYSPRLVELIRDKCTLKDRDESKLENSTYIALVNEIESIISSLGGIHRRGAREELSSKYASHQNLTSSLIIEALKTNPESYRINLGILVALEKAKYKLDSSALSQQLNKIKKSTLYRNVTIKEWYEKLK